MKYHRHSRDMHNITPTSRYPLTRGDDAFDCRTGDIGEFPQKTLLLMMRHCSFSLMRLTLADFCLMFSA